jgi:hypothetical protein
MQCAPAYREVCITTWVRAGLVAVTQVAQVACFNITVFTLIPTGTNLASLHKTVLYYMMTKPIRMRRSTIYGGPTPYMFFLFFLRGSGVGLACRVTRPRNVFGWALAPSSSSSLSKNSPNEVDLTDTQCLFLILGYANVQS